MSRVPTLATRIISAYVKTNAVEKSTTLLQLVSDVTSALRELEGRAANGGGLPLSSSPPKTVETMEAQAEATRVA